ncbi:MAG: sensor histidine kinase [Planctomycetota bacterium]|jgi:signal transduction histidine kinase
MRGGPRSREPRLDFFAYAADFTSSNPVAFSFDPALRAALEAGADVATAPYEADGKEGLQVAVRMDWSDGPCAVMVARRPWPLDSAVHRDLVRAAILLAAGMLAAVLLAAGPVVARIRRLTSAVRSSAADRYGTPVDAKGSDEIADLARAFNDAGGQIRGQIETIEERERTLREFVANTTHDVMIPLTVLQGHLADLRRRIDAGETPDRERVAEAADEAHYLASLVQNLEAAAKLDAAAGELQQLPVDLSRLVERVSGRHRPVADQRGISLEFAVPEEAITVSGDETLLEQAVSNLVHNAVRHNAEGGNVALTLEAAGEGKFSIRVADDGPGIATEDLEKVTQRSFRSDEARTRSPDGRGLGLHIAHSVCEGHGFTLDFAALEPSGLEAVISGTTATAEQEPRKP